MFNRIPLGKAVIILQQMFTAHSSQLTEMWGKQRSLLHGAWSSTDKPQHRNETNLWDKVGGRHDGTPKNLKETPVRESTSQIFIMVFKASKIKESFQT